MQILYSNESINENNLKYALKVLLKSKNEMSKLYGDLYNSEFDKIAHKHNHYSINNATIIKQLKDECHILSQQNDYL